MRITTILLVVLGIFLPVYAQEWWEKSNIPLVDSSTFYNYVLDKDHHTIVEFFTPWCRYCRGMAEDYEKAYETFASPSSPQYRPDIQFVRVNGDNSRDLVTEYGLTGYPLVAYFAPGNKDMDTKFAEQRETDYFIKFISEMCAQKIEKPQAIGTETENLSIYEEMSKIKTNNVKINISELALLVKELVNENINDKFDKMTTKIETIIDHQKIEKNGKEEHKVFDSSFKQKDFALLVCGVFIGFIIFSCLSRFSSPKDIHSKAKV